jgi:tRNA 2-thiouridine synthesizing protein A
MSDQTVPAADSELDARGQLCPMPILNAAKAMRDKPPGHVLRLLATDRGSLADVPAWAEDTGNELLSQHEEDGVYVFLLRKGEEEA